MILYDHVQVRSTISVKTDWGNQAVVELDLANLIDNPLEAEVAYQLAKLIDERAEEKRREAKRREE